MNKNYEVVKQIKTDGGSDIDGQYFIGGELSKEQALFIAENLATVDMQTLTELVMCDVSIAYKVINADTHKVVQTFKVMGDQL